MSSLIQKSGKTFAQSLRSLNGIFSVWKPSNQTVPDLQNSILKCLLDSSGAPCFKFISNFPLVLAPVQNLQETGLGSSGILLCGIGLGCKALPHISRPRFGLTQVYNFNFKFQDQAQSEQPPEQEQEHEQAEASRKVSKKKQNSKKKGPLSLPKLSESDFKEFIKTLNTEDETFEGLPIERVSLNFYGWPNFILRIQVYENCDLMNFLPFLNGKIVERFSAEYGSLAMGAICRMQIGPFYKYDALPESFWTVTEVGKAMRSVKVMHGRLFCDFFTENEWRAFGKFIP